jgi:ribose 5-phosphate isomerase A
MAIIEHCLNKWWRGRVHTTSRLVMNPNDLKVAVGHAAVAHVVPEQWLGVGTGSTVDCFIDALAAAKVRIRGAVSSSLRSTARLTAHGFHVVDASKVDSLPVYIDGADEIDARGFMVKGGGAALTREKIVADLAERFVCIADASKCVQTLGRFALPVEVIEMAAPRIARHFSHRYGGRAVLREGVITDNGHPLLDVHDLRIDDPLAMEVEINQWPGVVACGLFARHRADVLLVGTAQGVDTKRFD